MWVYVYIFMQDQGIQVLTKAIEASTEALEQHKGKLLVKEAPRTVSSSSSHIIPW